MSAQVNEAASGLPWGTTRDGEFTRTGVVAGSILGTLAVFTCFPLAIVGIVLSCMGLDRIKTDLPAAHRFLRASWAVFAVSPLPALLAVSWLAAR